MVGLIVGPPTEAEVAADVPSSVGVVDSTTEAVNEALGVSVGKVANGVHVALLADCAPEVAGVLVGNAVN